MTIQNFSFKQKSKGYNDIINISNQVDDCIRRSKINNGNVLVFVPGSTCGITTIEYEPGCVSDLKELYDRLVPMNNEYKHNLTWGDGNGFSHIRAALTKSNFIFPIVSGKAIIGTWQQIVLIDFDNASRERTIWVQIIGE